MKKASNNFVHFYMKEGIMRSYFLKDVEMDLPTIIEFINFRHAISEGEKQYWLHDLKGLKTMSKDAKEYASIYGEEFLHAGAIIVHTHLQKFLINTFIIVKKPKVKTRFFTDTSKALNWLLEVKTQHENSKELRMNLDEH